jgi:hypothetical protein
MNPAQCNGHAEDMCLQFGSSTLWSSVVTQSKEAFEE